MNSSLTADQDLPFAPTAAPDCAPPRSPAWPGLGDLLLWMRSPVTFGKRKYAESGPVASMRLFSRHYCLLLGPDATELVLMNRGRVFSSKLAWEPEIGRYFHEGLMLRDFDDHLRHRRVMQAAFRTEALTAYIGQMNPEIDRLTDAWLRRGDQRLDSATIHTFPTVKRLTLDLASRVFLGDTVGGEADRINAAFVDTVQASGPGAFVRVPIPGTLTWKGVRGRKVLEQYFRARLPEKRRQRSADFFSEFCHAETAEGESFSDDEIVNHMIFLMMAAHDTTNVTMNTMFYHLGKNPEWQDRCRAEAQALHSEHTAFEDLAKLPSLGLVMKEALRMVPAVPAIPRKTMEDVTFKGVKIPAGTHVAVLPALVHHMEEIWTEPSRFDPERFSPERAEDKRHKFAFIPFGGGVHKCIGLHFAELQVKAIFSQVLRRYRWELPASYKMRIDNTSLPRPKDNLPIELKRL